MLVAKVPACCLVELTALGADTAAGLRVLKQDCFSCHNPEKQKGGLVLTSREMMLKGGDSGVAVVPGKASREFAYGDGLGAVGLPACSGS